MKIEISNGELLDRISILELKLLNVKDPDKLANVERQFAALNPLCVKLFEERRRSTSFNNSTKAGYGRRNS